MVYGILADLVVLAHLAFILFAILGALLVLRWRRVIWLHIPAALWAVAIELGGWYCPLTPLENWLRVQDGTGGYRSGFVEHYILPLIYPASLTRELQFVLGALVLAINLAIYGWLILQKATKRRGSPSR